MFQSCICTRDEVYETMQTIYARKPMANNIGTYRKKNTHSVAIKLLKITLFCKLVKKRISST